MRHIRASSNLRNELRCQLRVWCVCDKRNNAKTDWSRPAQTPPPPTQKHASVFNKRCVRGFLELVAVAGDVMDGYDGEGNIDKFYTRALLN